MFTHSESPVAVKTSALKIRNESVLEMPVKLRQISAGLKGCLTGLKSHSQFCDVIALDYSI